MRKVKVIQVEGRGEVTVKEVSPFAVYQAWNVDGDRVAELRALLSDALQPSVDEIKAWYPSELEQVVSAWLEVNDGFFGIAAKLKLDGAMGEIVAAVTSSLPAVFASSLKQAIREPGNTDGLSL